MRQKKHRDAQKSKVYTWENAVFRCKDKSRVPYGNIQNLVDYVWAKEGLSFPPQVEPLPKQAKVYCATGSRLKLQFQETAQTCVILHEIAHAMTSDFEGNSNHHGSLFMGIFIQLLVRYMGLSYAELVGSAENSGLKVKIDAKPIFI